MQAINLDNYEEYFLLYADNELNAESRAAVEAFVALHPEKYEELALIQHACLPIDETISFDKAVLYKSEAQEINLNNYTEYFLLYVDNELSEAQKQETERFVLQHPQLQTEFTTLQQTILPKENIKFTNKEILYKRKNKRRPVIAMWQRVSAVAALLLIAVLVWQIFPEQNNTAGIAGISVADNSFNTNAVAVTNNNAGTHNNSNFSLPVIKQNNKTATFVSNKNFVNSNAGVSTLVNNNTNTLTNNIVTIYKDVAYNNKINNATVTDKNFENLTGKAFVSTVNTSIITTTAIINNDNNIAFAATTPEDENYLIGAFAVKKTKANSLFKKAINMFAKTAVNDEGKIEIASFAIDTNKF